MGRGRQKAKQTKVARELKYTTQHMDYEALQRELSSNSQVGPSDERYDDFGEVEDDNYQYGPSDKAANTSDAED